MMNLRSGIIEINGEKFSPGYTFEDFKNSGFYNGQDGVRIIRLKETVRITENNYIVSLFFRNGILYMLSLICTDVDFQFSEEIKRKQLHDGILEKNGLDTESFFNWGSIKSVYDPKGNVSSINIIYEG
ncbi:MAG: hypothetical protein LUG83_02815 [Lachnospiraceae bacterium]|nr:hypothetical protein [Lachnospiraceae bacterium]